MPKFSGSNATIAPPKGPMLTVADTVTAEGGVGFHEDSRTALFTLAMSNMVGESTYYESGSERDKRFVDLIRAVAAEDSAWLAGFVPWLRDTANMRSASVVAGVEAARAGLGRTPIVKACVRADEPAEALGYWLATYGRRIPAAVKRGIADAAVKLYTERNALKYDGGSRGVRMGDVIDLCHPKPRDAEQSALFRHLLDRRHNRSDSDTTALPLLTAAYKLGAVPQDQRRAVLRERGPEALADAGTTWERLSGWLPGGMDAEAWEAIIPNMGQMACVRNLRNFEDANISPAATDLVVSKLIDPEEVRRSRQFPYRYWSAYKNSGTMRFGYALEQALEHSVANVPTFTGRTLVAVDTSGSMRSHVSERSKVQCVEVGALFDAAIGASSKVDLIIYGVEALEVTERPRSVLRAIEQMHSLVGSAGHGTNTWPSVMSAYDGHDRIVVFTDMQDHPAHARVCAAPRSRPVPVDLPDVPIYVWDCRGYGIANTDLTQKNRYLLAGFTDAAFQLVSLLERGENAPWPWELPTR